MGSSATSNRSPLLNFIDFMSEIYPKVLRESTDELGRRFLMKNVIISALILFLLLMANNSVYMIATSEVYPAPTIMGDEEFAVPDTDTVDQSDAEVVMPPELEDLMPVPSDESVVE